MQESSKSQNKHPNKIDITCVNNWKFTNGGNLIFPDLTLFRSDYEGTGGFGIEPRINKSLFIKTENENDYEWEFDKNGILTFPDRTTLAGNISSTSNFGFDTRNAESGFSIITSGTSSGTSQLWEYNKDGSLTFPDGTFAGNDFDNSDFGFQTINKGFTIGTYTDERGQNEYFNWNYSKEGVLTFPDGTITSGSISGTSNFGFDTRASESNFSIITGTSTSTAQWTFGTDGVLNLPAGGDIKIGGNSVLSLRDNFFSEEFQIDDGTNNFSEDYGYKFATNIDFKFTDVDNNNVIYWKIPISKMPISNGHKSVYIDGVKLSNNHFFVTSSHLFIDTDNISPRTSPLGYYRINIDYQY